MNVCMLKHVARIECLDETENNKCKVPDWSVTHLNLPSKEVQLDDSEVAEYGVQYLHWPRYKRIQYYFTTRWA